MILPLLSSDLLIKHIFLANSPRINPHLVLSLKSLIQTPLKVSSQLALFKNPRRSFPSSSKTTLRPSNKPASLITPVSQPSSNHRLSIPPTNSIITYPPISLPVTNSIRPTNIAYSSPSPTKSPDQNTPSVKPTFTPTPSPIFVPTGQPPSP